MRNRTEYENSLNGYFLCARISKEKADDGGES